MATLESRLKSLAAVLGGDTKRIDGELKKRVVVPDLYSKINWNETIFVAHRCGSLVYPEQCAEALEAVYKTGGRLIPEIDIQELSDGTFILNHDSTVERTLSNIGTGVTESKTPAQWRQAKVKPIIPGGSYGTPLFWDDVLDKYGGKMMMFVELKGAVSPESVDRFCQQVVARGFQRSMIVFSFGFDVCQKVSTYGIETLFLSTNLPTKTPAQLIAAGIRHFASSINGNMTAANITAFKNAGIKVLQYTVRTPEEMTQAIAKGANGIISNDPWWHSGMIPWRGSDPFHEGYRPHGMEVYGMTGGEPTAAIENQISLIGDGIGFPVGQSVNTRNAHVTMPWAGKFQLPVTISFTIQFGRGDGTVDGQQHNAGISIYNVNNYRKYVDAAWPGQEAFTFIFRRMGQIAAYQCKPNVAPAAISSLTTTNHPNPFAAINRAGTVQCTIVLTQAKFYIYTNTIPTDIPDAYTTSPTSSNKNLGSTAERSWTPSGLVLTDYALALRFPSSGDARISDIQITPHEWAMPD